MAYTDEQKTEAVELYRTEGMAAAHAATGIPKPSIKRWADERGVTTERSAEQTQAATEAHVEAMTGRRWSIRRDLADTVTIVLQDLRNEDSAQKRQALAISVGVLVDKLAVVGWGDTEATTAPAGTNPDLERMREEARKRGRALVAV